MKRFQKTLMAGLLLAGGCSDDGAVKPDPKPLAPVDPKTLAANGGEVEAPGKKVVQPPAAPEVAPPESKRLGDLPPVKTLLERVPSYFDGRAGHRLYVQVDKPLYKPGETVWIRSWDLRSKDLAGAQGASLQYQLVSPKGAVVLKKRVALQNGLATNDFELPDGVQGGEYQIRIIAEDGVQTDRPIIVSTYEPPRMKKKLEFVRKAYGEGDEVTATLELKRPTGEPLANKTVEAVVRLDDVELPRVKVTTNAEGGALVRFTLPGKIERGDGLLTVLVDDGGVTESVSKSVPIIVKRMQLAFFPEGGQIIAGQPGRVYFEGKTPLGKPADLEGQVRDEMGNVVAQFRSDHQGLGRIEFTPNTGRTYSAEITKPVGVTEKYALPLALAEGCTVRSFDDLDTQEPALRVAVRCSAPRKVVVAGVLRDQLLDAAAVDVPANDAAVVYLKAKDEKVARAQGVARVTVFDEQLNPLAERLVYRNRRNLLKVSVKPDQATYTPREQIALKIKTEDALGQPVPADLALSVVDDTVVSFADDKTGHMLSRVFLEHELPDKVEEPNVYFDLTEAKSARATDLLMGTRGWRKFEWQPVLTPPMPMATGAVDGLGGFGRGGGGGAMRPNKRAGGPPGAQRARAEEMEGGALEDMAAMAQAPAAMAEPMAVMAEQAPKGAPAAAAAPARPMPRRAPAADAPAPAPMAPPPPPPAEERAMEAAKPRQIIQADKIVMAEKDEAWDGAEKKKADRREARGDVAEEERDVDDEWVMAPVRVFPAPNYGGDFSGPRTDFRETIHWAPQVRTGKDGEATVTFFASDAITSFRVFVEGTGGGLAGRHEEVVQSKLPFSMSVKLPVEVSAGDRMLLPLTFTNERDRVLPIQLTQDFGPLLKLDTPTALKGPGLPANASESLYFPVTVTGVSGKSPVRFAATAGGLSDEFIREVQVVPLGFPQQVAKSGTVQGKVTATFDVGDATPGTVEARLQLYPSPVATITSGLDGLIREPSGCFEQTSSSNYPNVMVLQYLKAADVADPALVQRTGDLLDRGYKKLVGFETREKGYEWFGSNPGHEALTAYGILEFLDMKRVYGGVDDDMIQRTVKWLEARRDGKGGFQRNPQALDSFGAAGPEVTDAYITWAVAEAGLAGQFGAEIDAAGRRAQTTKDPYLLALAANTLLNVPARAQEGAAAVARLAEMQKADGVFGGAAESITKSGGVNLDIETTSLATLALLEGQRHPEHVRRSIQWLNDHRGGYGEWGATQATVLALKAMTEYAIAGRATRGPGSVTVLVNGRKVADFNYPAGHRETIDFHALGSHFTQGKNEVEVLATGGDPLPYSMVVDYRAVKPATHPDVAVQLSTRLDRSAVKMGENVRLTAVLENRTSNGLPMTMARVGLPGGLSFQTWQLKELKEKGLVDQWETRAREVILYYRQMKPSEKREIPLDLVALVPGEYTGPSSSAYLYYTNDQKFWADGLKVSVTR